MNAPDVTACDNCNRPWLADDMYSGPCDGLLCSRCARVRLGDTASAEDIADEWSAAYAAQRDAQIATLTRERDEARARVEALQQERDDLIRHALALSAGVPPAPGEPEPLPEREPVQGGGAAT